MKNVVVYPNAKINIGLKILSKREDGYHLIDSYFYPARLYDILEIAYPANSEGMQLSVSGIEIPGDLSDNLLFKCYDLVKERFKELPPVEVHLHKQIPIGAGLGGGSSDAAFFVKELMKIVNGSENDASEILQSIGSDCSYFLKNDAQHVTGIGHDMEKVEINLNGKYVLMVFPEIKVSTKEAYSDCYISGEHLLPFSMESLIDGGLTNDFEVSLFKKYPSLSEIKNHLIDMGALYASLSGSGSTIYGIFESKPKELKEFSGADYALLQL